MNDALKKNPLVELIQPEQFLGWTWSVNYEEAVVLTHETLQTAAYGAPNHCFLLATTLDASNADSLDNFAILLRVTSASPLLPSCPAEDTRLTELKSRAAKFLPPEPDVDAFGGLHCRILGTFHLRDGQLRLGSDVESFINTAALAVYRPTARALETVVNYSSPERTTASLAEAQRLGLKGDLPRFPIGTVRYSSTDRLHRGGEAGTAAFKLNAIDFLARRTAVFGMTRTGKSNTVKQLVSVVMRAGVESGLKIGQIIYDLNGEYANANQQDKGSIAEVYPSDTVRYRMIPTAGFEPILNNFFTQIVEGHHTLRGLIELNRVPRSADLDAFLAIDFAEPRREDFENDATFTHHFSRYKRKISAYQAVLARAGFELPDGFKIAFDAGPSIRNKVNPTVDPANGLSAEAAYEWFQLARQIQDELITGNNQNWVEPDMNVLMNLLLQKNDQGAYIPGFRLLQPFKDYHAPNRTTDVCDEIYGHLLTGKIVILDLSVGDPTQRERLSKRIARHILQSSMTVFNSGHVPPNIVLYVEEAHNLIGRNESLTEVWPTIAKEGAKARLATVYATQEVSSIHPNILANTENILCSHLNNENEISELAKYYDFRDFSKSIIRAQDVGFSRAKTLSNPFVIPIQIDKFDPEKEKQFLAAKKTIR